MTNVPKGARANPPAYKLKAYDRAELLWANTLTATDRANTILAGRPAGALGPLTLAPSLHSDLENSMLQIRSEPSKHLAGAELRCAPPSGKPGANYTKIVTNEIVTSAELLWERRETAAALVEGVRSRTEGVYCREFHSGRYPAITAIGVALGPLDSGVEIILDLEALTSGHTWSTTRVHGRSTADLNDRLMQFTNEQIQRYEVLAGCRADRIVGRVQETVSRVLSHVGMDLDFVVDHLSRQERLVFDFGDGDYQCDVRWSADLLECHLSADTRGWRLTGDTLWLKGITFPDVIQNSLVGRRLGDVFSNEVLPSDAVITWAEDRPDVRVIWLAIPKSPIPDPDDKVGQVIRHRLSSWPDGGTPLSS